MSTVDRLEVFPIKSLDGCQVDEATFTSGGALEFDRRWALIDDQGNFVNAKRYAQIHAIRCNFDLATLQLNLHAPGMPDIQSIIDDSALSDWFSKYFDRPIYIQENTLTGFPDDTDSPGPTIISTASLQEIASWYPNLSVIEIRRRLRTNIEIGGVPAFWEDRLFANNPSDFSIGNILLQGINPCQRCIVPTRDATTGSIGSGFQKIFSEHRAANLPPQVDRSRFNHFYRAAVNTRLPDSAISESMSPAIGHSIRVGDSIQIT
jgi:uncharacterized protein